MILLAAAVLARPSEPLELARAYLVATGDVMMHGPVKASAAAVATPGNHGGYDVVWGDVAPAISAADLAFANLEFPVAPTTGQPGRSKVFNGPPAALDSLRAVGFDLVSFANNHAYDQGRPGLLETVDQLGRAGLQQVGAGRTCDEARAVRLIDVQGVRLGFVGATAVLNLPLNGKGPCVAEVDPEWILADVAQARAHGAEIVVVSLHWGTEYATEPDAAQVELAHRLVEGGVDVILGHHPHVLQRIEWVQASDGRRALVAYSLGNFVSNQSAFYVPERFEVADGLPRDGVLLGFDVVRRAYGRGRRLVVRTEVDGVRVEPLWTVNDDVRGIRVVALDRWIVGLERQIAHSADDDECERLDLEREELQRRRDAIFAAVGSEWSAGSG
jgi:poly-gamma-glutamate synthesis protein (capsule biosynthesis protein)